MAKRLPPRPNLDHLRRQAKSLLAALANGDQEAIKTLREHLPAARSLSDAQMRRAEYRLADAQSALARKNGFANWPALARHVEQLRSLEGTWEFLSLEVDGRPLSATMLATSRILIDGDRFRSETPGATYEGEFNIDVEADPHGIDIEFVAGPEAGNTNYGIFNINDADQLTICLNMSGPTRPRVFATSPGSGQALETLCRTSSARPSDVQGGVAKPQGEAAGRAVSAADFPLVSSETLTRLQGEWAAVKLVQDGQEMPAFMTKTGRRVATDNELKVWFGGQLMIHALVRIDEGESPLRVDYLHQAGPLEGRLQHGILAWQGEEACFCMSPPASPRPADFSCAAGSAHTLSLWRRVK
jgi:uncharacterized protein (TIGR03067 family)